MKHTISSLSVSDIDSVDHLMKRNSRTLGFLPRPALEEALRRGDVLGAQHKKHGLVGYLLYASYEERLRITTTVPRKSSMGFVTC